MDRLSDFSGKDYYNEKIINFVNSIGYQHRIGNYYYLVENDGYINISYLMSDGIEIIQFHKNFIYTGASGYTKKDIHQEFYNYTEFVKFISIYHKKECRKIKLTKLNEI